MIKIKQRIIVFILAGIISIYLEMQIIKILIFNFDINPQLTRIVSLPPAIIFTWLMNRRFGFLIKTKPKIDEFLKYLNANLLSQTINFILFTLIISYNDYFIDNVFITLCISSIVSVLISFVLYNVYVFREK